MKERPKMQVGHLSDLCSLCSLCSYARYARLPPRVAASIAGHRASFLGARVMCTSSQTRSQYVHVCFWSSPLDHRRRHMLYLADRELPVTTKLVMARPCFSLLRTLAVVFVRYIESYVFESQPPGWAKTTIKRNEYLLSGSPIRLSAGSEMPSATASGFRPVSQGAINAV